MGNYVWKYKTPEGFDDLVMCGDGEGAWRRMAVPGSLTAKAAKNVKER